MKKRLMFCVCSAVLISLPFFCGEDLDPTAHEAFVSVEGKSATYAGKISSENVDRFLGAVEGREIETLVIASSGGEINAGMRLGSWVFENEVDVVVECMCMSSCANYVFTAGREKTISPGAIVAWHGSILQEAGMSDEDVRAAAEEAYGALTEEEKSKVDLEEMVRTAVKQMQEYRTSSEKNQAAFFEKIGVDEYICRVGSERCGAEDFYSLSVEDMALFGVEHVKAQPDYEKTDLAPFRSTGKSVVFVTVPKDYRSGESPGD